MPAPPGQPLNIFLSCVSSQFRPCRDDLASALRTVGYKVTVQEDFPLTDFFLLEKLQNFIASCDLVIALIGDAYGFEPEVRTSPRRSYTQWEYHFALGERLSFAHDSPPVPAGRQPAIPIRRYFASPDYLAAHLVTQPGELSALQNAFIQSIHQSNKDWGTFSTCHELRANVLRDLSKPLRHERRPNNLPYPTLGSLFVGREKFLTELRASLIRATESSHATAIVQTQAVHGLGGIGKTRLAVEYAWQHEKDYSALLFVVADSPENLRRNLAALCGPFVLNLPEHAAPQEEARVAAALRWLERNPGWFLILDNVDGDDAAKAAEDLLVHLRQGHILITTRIAKWGRHVRRLELDVLSPEDSTRFLLEASAPDRRQLPTDPADAAELARELDGLALGLEQAAAYIQEQRCSIREYLAEWRAHNPNVQDWYDERLMKYPRSLAVTWQTTAARLEPSARQALNILAWFAPEPIPRFVFEPETAAAQVGKEQLAALANYSLLRFGSEDRGSVQMHRVLQEITRSQTPPGEIKKQISVALELLDAVAPADPADVRTWPVWNPLRPHLAHLLALADAQSLPEPTARLMNQLALLLQVKALHTEAEPLFRRALAIDELSFGPNHPNVATGLSNFAQLLKATNRLAEAEPLMRRALAIDELSFGPNHPNVARGLNNFARLLQDTNRLAEAEPLMRRALAIFEQSLGLNHSHVAMGLNNLAGLLKATNRLAEAEPLFRRVVSIFEQSFGEHHPNVATALNNFARLLHDTNRLAEAEPLFRRALAIDELSFGPNHPNVARGLNNLATLLKDTNRLPDAEPLFRRALAIDERSFGEHHPNVATALNNLATLLHDTDRLAEAEPLFRRALAIDEQSFGPNHPKVAIRLNNLAALLQDTNRLSEAEPLFVRALAIDEQSFGPEHPNVARDLNNLAQLLQATNRLGEAEPLMWRHVEIFLKFTRATGHSHPHLNAAFVNYFVLLTQMGNTPAQAQAKITTLAQSHGVSLG